MLCYTTLADSLRKIPDAAAAVRCPAQRQITSSVSSADRTNSNWVSVGANICLQAQLKEWEAAEAEKKALAREIALKLKADRAAQLADRDLVSGCCIRCSCSQAGCCIRCSCSQAGCWSGCSRGQARQSAVGTCRLCYSGNAIVQQLPQALSRMQLQARAAYLCHHVSVSCWHCEHRAEHALSL
jgi:hypothetical protein